jgi:hypothetical protein
MRSNVAGCKDRPLFSGKHLDPPTVPVRRLAGAAARLAVTKRAADLRHTDDRAQAIPLLAR